MNGNQLDHVGNAGIYDIHVALLSHRHRHMHHFPIFSTHHKGGPQAHINIKDPDFWCMYVLISVDPSVKEFRVYCGEFCFISRKILVCLFFGLFFFFAKVVRYIGIFSFL